MQTITLEIGTRFAATALGHVTREYPHKPDIVLEGAADSRLPSDLHPIFHGSYDWHSCVHGYWLLARLMRLFPDGSHADATRALFDRQLVAEKVATECAYLAAPTARGFERPYGWAWLLKLADALSALPDSKWSHALAPLTDVFVQRFKTFLPIATYPMRAGVHSSTAFALRMAADYGESAGDNGLAALLLRTAERWYENDVACPAWGEPSGDDFLSPALMEAECMRRLLSPERFLLWFDRFLPGLAMRQPANLFCPATVADRSDGKIAHLDGLNLSRAWCLRGLAGALPEDDRRGKIMRDNAEMHLNASLPHLSEDYMGEHWLASFALLALEA